jgi:hypothetical protein
VGDIQVHLINFIKSEAFKRLYKELQQLPKLNINDINSWGNDTSDWFLREEEPATIRQETIEVDIPSPPHTPWPQSNPELNNWATTSTGIETGIDNHGWTSINRVTQEQGIKLPLKSNIITEYSQLTIRTTILSSITRRPSGF